MNQSQPLIPARMVNEYVYCPRLAWLEWIQGEWTPSVDTIQGSHVHKRVDLPAGAMPASDKLNEDSIDIHARSIDLSSERLGVTAKLDLVEGTGNVVQPVDYKRGKRPHIPANAYDPERVQLCLQGLLLREHGYHCESGVLYFAASKERVTIQFDDELCQLTLDSIEQLRTLSTQQKMPPPLDDSPKCPRCSLVGICLPDETQFLTNAATSTTPRSISIKHDRRMPLVVQADWWPSINERYCGPLRHAIFHRPHVVTYELLSAHMW